MEQAKRFIFGLSPWISGAVMGIAMVLQIALSFFLHNPAAVQLLQWVGYAAWTLSAVFGIAPIITFRVKGRVPKGKGYMHTTVLVDSGVYAIVRHPQYLAGVLINLALTLITQHWLIGLLGLVATGITIADAFRADRDGIEKFGAEYERYMQRVPRMNFVAGIVRLARRGKSGT
jgi:protein-S-isoprenylcysteine O-methyltransferase Ste14